LIGVSTAFSLRAVLVAGLFDFDAGFADDAAVLGDFRLHEGAECLG
jgi:hypothetical protein